MRKETFSRRPSGVRRAGPRMPRAERSSGRQTRGRSRGTDVHSHRRKGDLYGQTDRPQNAILHSSNVVATPLSYDAAIHHNTQVNRFEDPYAPRRPPWRR